ncbi:MAG: DUF4834 domain-containing protein [Flavobacterium sp.]|jgi:hypothetical protein|uniref:DUF4834 domain-containing protein n=1 Tax=Flavobacterium sp. TaxID=239 RepID=UPI003BA3FCDB
MQTASIPGFIRTILIIIGIYYAFKLISRILLPILLRKMVQKAEKSFQQQMEFQQQQQAANQAPPKAKMTEKKKVGEYIDYEEVN